MDNQNFNEDELSDIMKEIESLEEDFSPEKIQESPVMKKLSQMDENQSVPKSEEFSSEAAEIFPFEAKTNHPKSAMSFKVEGNMSIDLQFEVGGKVVCLEVTEKGLSIQMDGGVTFTVPVDGHKKSA